MLVVVIQFLRHWVAVVICTLAVIPTHFDFSANICTRYEVLIPVDVLVSCVYLTLNVVWLVSSIILAIAH